MGRIMKAISEYKLNEYVLEIVGNGGSEKRHFDTNDVLVDANGYIIYAGKQDNMCFDEVSSALRKMFNGKKDVKFMCNERTSSFYAPSLKKETSSPHNGLTAYSAVMEAAAFKNLDRVSIYDKALKSANKLIKPSERFDRLLKLASEMAGPLHGRTGTAAITLQKALKIIDGFKGYQKVISYRMIAKVFTFLGANKNASISNKKADELEKILAKKVETRVPPIIVRDPTKQEAFDTVMLYIQYAPFLKSKGYTFHLPDHPEFQKFLSNGKPQPVDKPKLLKIYNNIYNPDAYQSAVKKLKDKMPKIERAFKRLLNFHDNWGFVIHPKYDILFNFGGLGDGNPKTGVINMALSKKDGSFSMNRPLDMVIHEAIHTGIDVAVSDRYKLSWDEREKLVDLICHHCFRDILPDYKISYQKDSRMDEFIDFHAVMNDLPGAIKKYVTKYPR